MPQTAVLAWRAATRLRACAGEGAVGPWDGSRGGPLSRVARTLLWLLLSAGMGAGAEDPLASARRALEEGRLEAAAQAYAARLAQAPDDTDARVGAGFAALRRGRLSEAEAHFSRAEAMAPRYADAAFGLALVRERQGRIPEAKAALRRALALDGARPEFQEAMGRLLRQAPEFPPRVRPHALQLPARVSAARGFEVRDGQGWRSLFIKGMNLGAALPGRHPSEFPDKPTYEGWIRDMAELGINAIRVYTIHPPAFYEALRAHNLRAPRPIYLIHGVWAEPPPGDDFRDRAWFGAWKEEMRRVVDLLHGHAWIPERPGHAGGLYQADLSPWWIATILGREWEPFNVTAFNAKHPGTADWSGKLVTVRQGHATERFMAEAMDAMLAYELEAWNAQRPMAYTNWPTLDPLHHPTESTKAEEAVLRRKLGLPLEKGAAVKEYDNDAVGLDMEKVDTQPAFQAGLFASYHAYPYYPDFLNLDPGYLKAADHLGPNAYMGYLRELVAHHRRHAVVISEVGVPASRLVAHEQPQGLTHGGQDERAQGEQDARLLRNAYDAGCAGVALFAWVDEWFKKNWLVIDFEEPLERNRLWYNPLDAEQNYGLIGARPGAEGPTILVDGRPDDWAKVSEYLREGRFALKLKADEGWLHLGIFWDGHEPDWATEGLLVGLDTHGAGLGDHRLPFGLGLRSAAGLEMVAVFQGERSALLVDEPYDLFTHRYARPYRSVANDRGRFVMPRTESNRMRIGRDGTVFPPLRQEIGWLRRGTQDRTDPAFDSRAEWQAGPGFLEARLPWGLLNVTDPSSRQVVRDTVPPGEAVGTVKTEGFRAVLVRFAGRALGDGAGPLRPLRALPAADAAGTLGLPPCYTWPEWEVPTYHLFRKLGFTHVQEALRALPEAPRPRR